MVYSPSSPERSHKVTYGGRAKRKRHNTDDAAYSDSDARQSETSSLASATCRSKKPATPSSDAKSKAEEQKPPSPKRVRQMCEQIESSIKPPPKRLAGGHTRKSSSVGSLSRVTQMGPPQSSPSAKPASRTEAKNPASSPAFKTPEINGSISGTESYKDSSKSRRSEAERIQYFKDQELCADLEPHRVRCTKCDKFISLGRKQTYTVRPWETHRTRCDRQDASIEFDDKEDDVDDASTVAPSVSHSEASVRRTEGERRAVLESDPRAQEIKSHEVLCRKCQKWIQLSKSSFYALSNWNRHQLRCADIIPSSRVAAAERKLKIVNDKMVKSFTSRSVECASCGTVVTLEGEGDYNLTKWTEHKACGCNSANNSVVEPDGNSEVSPPASCSLSSPSSSLDTTLIVPEPDNKYQSSKRPRDDEGSTVSDDADLRPLNRPRSEKYVPVEKEAPGPFGWFLLPFKAFARGFREGLASTK